MSISYDDVGSDLRRIAISGRLDLPGTDSVATKLMELVAAPKRAVVVDLSALKDLNANGKHTYGKPVALFDGKTTDGWGVQMARRGMNWTVAALQKALKAGTTSSEKLVGEALERIADPKLEGAKVFIKVLMVPRERRETAWARLAADLTPQTLDAVTEEIGLAAAIARAPEVLAGRIRGRLVVDVNR